jgi:hypothetical protein
LGDERERRKPRVALKLTCATSRDVFVRRRKKEG